jgi:hypothetical protein
MSTCKALFLVAMGVGAARAAPAVVSGHGPAPAERAFVAPAMHLGDHEACVLLPAHRAIRLDATLRVANTLHDTP